MELEKLEIIEGFLRIKFPAAGIILCNSFHEPYFEIQVGSELLVLTVGRDFLQQVRAEDVTDRLANWGVVEALERSRSLAVLLSAKGMEMAERRPEVSY
ncbi:MAG: hypothetical protein JXK94_11060 [Deltaproteobacteria bacterium]|nr:hypothetical protein [Deltaproteobacteria bacterium]